ncbi:class I SAM-dependent methyltransferase [bacterium]|nr:class I SAM-dependent methyltransferase [bacterium]
MSDYYNEHYREYFESTFFVDPSSFLTPLSERLAQGATVLDIGCGSGRDLLWLKKKGFQPTGFEYAPNLAEIARQHSGCPVLEGDFSTFDFSQLRFDALLLVGALVHVERTRIKPILSKICKALSGEGYVYLTLKEGQGQQHADDGRIFTLWPQDDLEKIFTELNLTILDISKQVSKIRKSDVWLGYLMKMKRYEIDSER